MININNLKNSTTVSKTPLTFENLKFKWFFKYKIYHIPFWCVYHYLFWVIGIGSIIQVTSTILFSIYAIKFIFYVLFQAIAVYFNLYFLIPRYLEKSKFREYIIYLFLSLICASFLIVSGYYIIAIISDKSFEELFNVPPNKIFHFFWTASFPSTIASTTLAMSIKLTKNWIETKKRQQILEKEKLETELKFLKYQFNPHFLFNTINSIFFLIHKNPNMASDSLAKFSDLLRYQLFECNENRILLTTEIQYCQNFIELEKLRQNKNLIVTTSIEKHQTSHLAIAPFILMTFVENSFKHVSKDPDKENWIKLKLYVEDQTLNFFISNSISLIITKDVMQFGGIGLINVQRRLELLYPNAYKLSIKSETNTFKVDLKISLSQLLIEEEKHKIVYL